jgi:hypothetical protein
MTNSDVKELYEYLKELLKASRFLVNRKDLKHDITNIKKMIKYIDDDRLYKILKDYDTEEG